MKSAGNDIVALALINKQRTNELRFYSKILSKQEQALYQAPEFAGVPFEYYVWLLWSIKESAYKYVKRLNAELLFSPTKITVQPINIQNRHFYGTVACDNRKLYSRSEITEECITSVVNDAEDFAGICWGAEKIDDTASHYQSNAARSLLLNQLKTYFPGDLRIEKSTVGYPTVLNNNAIVNIPASLAHHGHFVSYSFHIGAISQALV